jgi:polysaccharide deacetylase family protein (PEP-CTERM system associated)
VAKTPTTPNYLTIDFEDWFQGLTSTQNRRELWPDFQSCIENTGHWLLDTLKTSRVPATFFIVGQVARDHPELVARIAADGHEIGLHGDLHRRVDRLTRTEFVADLQANIAAIESTGASRPTAFRAPCFSIGPGTPWVWEALAANGVTLDSSVFPIQGLIYGQPDAPRQRYRVETPSGPVTEHPVSTVRLFGQNLPFSGGFYFRALPYALIALATKQLNASGEGVMFYFHPWEFAPAHQRPPRVTGRERLSHYGFLAGARSKFARLLADFPFARLGDGNASSSRSAQ